MNGTMQFIDLAAQQRRIRDKIEANIRAVLDHGQYIQGPEIEELEARLAEYVGVGHAVACASGTDALLLALLAKQVGPGDAIFTTPFTFVATAEVISLVGATPVFVDIDPRTFNIDPDKLELAIQAMEGGEGVLHPLPSSAKDRGSSLRPRGIIAVDLFGLMSDYDGIDQIAKPHDLFVIEDAAQSFGAEHRGRRACSLADIACTSFFPAKPLGCYGDGGMCFTNDQDLAEVLRSLRVHGKGGHKYDTVRVGINGRLDTIQAAILLAKLDVFDEELELRQQAANRYSEPLGVQPSLVTPHIPSDYKSAWAQYSILCGGVGRRASLQERLHEAGIPTAVYYPKPLHLQPAFGFLGYQAGDFPVSEDCSRRILSLPMHPYLGEGEQRGIVERLIDADRALHPSGRHRDG